MSGDSLSFPQAALARVRHAWATRYSPPTGGTTDVEASGEQIIGHRARGSEWSFQASKVSVLESKVQAGFCQTSMAWTERRDYVWAATVAGRVN
jgi:hypothetical protein